MVFSRMNDRIKSAKEIIYGTREISGDIFELKTKNAKLQQELNNRPQWISVEDSLPKSETTKYIVMFSLFYAPSYIDTSVFVDGKWSITKEDPRLGRVTHWMPLPEPPTQEQGE